MTRTAASRRPCTFGNTAGIHEFTASVFMSFVTRPLRNITASEPLTKKRPRDERSMRPAPPSRTAVYSADRAALVITNRQRLILCGFAAAQCGEACLTVGRFMVWRLRLRLVRGVASLKNKRYWA